MMVGLPGDNEIRSLTTARAIADLQPDFVRIYPTVVVENSRLAGWYKNGSYTPLSLEEGVTLVKKIYQLFKEKNIEVIRMGLQATVLAGPYHPAFGHMVYSEIFLDMAASTIESTESLSDGIAIYVNPRSVSKMRGLKNTNVERLKKRYHFKFIEVVPDSSLVRDELVVGKLKP
jgi:histone acetyltransferase (RNA polymerase elongator complex component)